MICGFTFASLLVLLAPLLVATLRPAIRAGKTEPMGGVESGVNTGPLVGNNRVIDCRAATDESYASKARKENKHLDDEF